MANLETNELTTLKQEIEINNNEKTYSDANFSYNVNEPVLNENFISPKIFNEKLFEQQKSFRDKLLIDFWVSQFTNLLISLFSLGLEDFLGKERLKDKFFQFWGFSVIAILLLVSESVYLYIHLRKKTVFSNPYANFYFFVFVILSSSIFFVFSLLSNELVLSFAVTVNINIVILFVLNCIPYFDNKTLFKLISIFASFTIFNILYLVILKTLFVVFFSFTIFLILYFSYIITQFKRLYFNDEDPKKFDDELREKSYKVNPRICMISTFADLIVFNFI